MPIMTRMRDSMPTILFGLLIAFLITIIFEWGMDYTGMSARGSNVVGSINGKDVTYTEYADVLREHTENHRARSGGELSEAQIEQLRDEVWEGIVSRSLVFEEMDRMGIVVSDEEIIEWVRGENPPEDLKQSFLDSTGLFRRDLYEQFLADPNQFVADPQGVDQKFGSRWLANYEGFLRERRGQEKLRSLLNAMVVVGEGELRQAYVDEHATYEFKYALLDANQLIPDSLIEVAEDDIRNYYNENLSQQKIDARRTIKYVHLREQPSRSDSDEVRILAENLVSRARGGEDFLDLVYTYDESPDSGAFFDRGELNPDLEEAAFSTAPGQIVGPLLVADGYHVMKVLETRRSDKEFVHASHILFSPEPGEDTLAVRAQAREIAALIRGGADFASLAREYSKDPGSAQRGGDLGWFGRKRMVKEFEDAAFRGRPGETVGPVRTQFGWHVIKIHGRESRSVKIVDLHIPIAASPQTVNELFDRASDFAYNARQGDFTREAQSVGMEARDAELTEKGTAIPGLGVHKEAVRWAFSNDVGDVSEPFDVSNGYAVIVIVDAKDAGIRPFEEVKDALRPATLRAMKIDRTLRMAGELRSRLAEGDSLSRVTALDPMVSMRNVGPIKLTGAIPGVGRDQGFVGAVENLAIGEISQPVKGTRGAYLIQLVGKSEFDEVDYAARRPGLRTKLLQDRRNRFYNDWLANLKESADIEDNRAALNR
ncbi:MAG: peptidylprolyl isomerase [Ignavibacteria bacterium]|nr:peptidylprolyl isomerase [Ignavibacteria bacterium]